jgi:CBS-domain-containing membrane protein
MRNERGTSGQRADYAGFLPSSLGISASERLRGCCGALTNLLCGRTVGADVASQVPVVDEERRLSGIISQAELVAALYAAD